MDRNLIHKYFRDECSGEELAQVLQWFQTDEGQEFLKQDFYRESRQFIDNTEIYLYPEIDSERIFNRIQRHKQQDTGRCRKLGIRVASIVFLLVSVLSTLLYWGEYVTLKKESPEPLFHTYSTEIGQQKIFTLADGTIIRLNEESSLIVPDKIARQQRQVELKGEAYFEVAHDSDHPFLVKTRASTIQVLGTKFNIKADTLTHKVELAVIQGKVALKMRGAGDTPSALLTRNTFGVLDLSNSQITIEKVNTQNYLSWINNRLVFTGETLAKVSRQLGRIYDVKITFETARLKKLKLTADIGKADLPKVLDTISETFGISYRISGHTVVWTE